MHHEQPSWCQPVGNKNDATLHNTKATVTCLTYTTSLYYIHVRTELDHGYVVCGLNFFFRNGSWMQKICGM